MDALPENQRESTEKSRLSNDQVLFHLIV